MLRVLYLLEEERSPWFSLLGEENKTTVLRVNEFQKAVGRSGVPLPQLIMQETCIN